MVLESPWKVLEFDFDKWATTLGLKCPSSLWTQCHYSNSRLIISTSSLFSMLCLSTSWLLVSVHYSAYTELQRQCRLVSSNLPWPMLWSVYWTNLLCHLLTAPHLTTWSVIQSFICPKYNNNSGLLRSLKVLESPWIFFPDFQGLESPWK